MCRFLAYTGEPVTLSSLMLEPPHSLLQQCRAPRYQTRTKDNPDGFGVAWFTQDGIERYRRPTPMWQDAEFPGLARAVSSRAFLAGIRKASPGLALGDANTPPYVADGWAFAHNGFVGRWHEDGEAFVRTMASPARATLIEGSTDSEAMFAAVLTRMDDGASPDAAVCDVVSGIARAVGGYLTVMMTDGHTIVAAAWGNSVFVRRLATGMIVASEPYDDDPAWIPVPDRSLVVADATVCEIEAMEEVNA